ncbi:hypothetical protein BJY01DRAFT_247203 [Aspergillus pseudoustus]|uniref:BTB domain-containing protein n=1 Tax=Aspergillus pseudoustus TaxID=1810923 RepID=A0ABR4K599_9EURO
MPSKHLQRGTFKGGIATITVGREGTRFTIHRELLRNCSPYFNQRLPDRSRTPVPNPTQEFIWLPDDDPSAFATFALWAYTGAIDNDTAEQRACPDRILHLFRVWELAGKIQAPKLRALAFEE